MDTLIDLDRYPLDQAGSDAWRDFVTRCKTDLERDGLFNLPGLIRAEAVTDMVDELKHAIESASFTHEREHNIYFKKSLPDLPDDHPALQKFRTSNRTICADQMEASAVMRLYEWPPFAAFLAAVMDKDRLWTMDDPLARANVMAYREGQALNWHFDRSEFTTTLLLQAPATGGEFEYAKDLRRDDEPNYDGVARLLNGDEPTTLMPLEPGTLNVFRGKNTAHRVTEVKGNRDRIIAVYSFFDRPGVTFTEEDRIGFYGRAS